MIIDELMECMILIGTTINTAFLVVIYHRQKWGKK